MLCDGGVPRRAQTGHSPEAFLYAISGVIAMHQRIVNVHYRGPEIIRLHQGSDVRSPRSRWAWLPILAFWTLAAPVAGTPVKSLEVVNAWSRATPPGINIGVAYFDIVNRGEQDVLERVESPVARQAEMHSMTTVAGVMQMRELHSLNVPAGGRVRFEPNNLHVMLIDLVQPLKKGDRFSLTLVFRHAGAVHVEAIVQDLGAMSGPGIKGSVR